MSGRQGGCGDICKGPRARATQIKIEEVGGSERETKPWWVDGQQASNINSKSTMMTQKHDNLTLSSTWLESCFHTFSSNAFLPWFNKSQANVFSLQCAKNKEHAQIE